MSSKTENNGGAPYFVDVWDNTIGAWDRAVGGYDIDEANPPPGVKRRVVLYDDLILAICGDEMRDAAETPLSAAADAVDEFVRRGGTLTENGVEYGREDVIEQVKRHIAHCAIVPVFGLHDFDEDGKFFVTVMNDGLIVPFRKDGGLQNEYSEGVTVKKMVDDALYVHDNREGIEGV